MNRAGVSLKQLMRTYKLFSSDVLVVYDDVDLELGKLRFRKGGSSAGHRGISSIIEALGTEEVNRLRIGICRPQSGELSDYVLANFAKSEKELLESVLATSAQALLDWVRQDIDYVMRTYNVRNKKEDK